MLMIILAGLINVAVYALVSAQQPPRFWSSSRSSRSSRCRDSATEPLNFRSSKRHVSAGVPYTEICVVETFPALLSTMQVTMFDRHVLAGMSIQGLLKVAIREAIAQPRSQDAQVD